MENRHGNFESVMPWKPFFFNPQALEGFHCAFRTVSKLSDGTSDCHGDKVDVTIDPQELSP